MPCATCGDPACPPRRCARLYQAAQSLDLYASPAFLTDPCNRVAWVNQRFARLIGERKRAYFRLGYGFSRSRNGAINMHAASCIAAVSGAWQLEGGGAFHNNGAVFHLNNSVIEGSDLRDPSIRMLDQSRIGAILTSA